MIEIKDLLNRFANILVSEEGKKESIKSAVLAATGIEVRTSDISIKGDTVYLDIKPIYKNEVFLKKNKIAKELEEIAGKKIPKKIR